MKLREAYRATTHWAPFVGRTIGYGTVSLTLGPLTSDRRASLWAMRAWCKASTRGLNIEVAASGVENVPRRGAFVYCSNHQSLVDILVLGSVLPGDYKWAAKRSLMKIPFLGWHLRLAGHVPVDRGAGSRAAADAIARFRRSSRAASRCWSSRKERAARTASCRDFKIGGFLAAARQGVPVVPIAIEGTHRLMRKGAFDLGDGAMRHVALRVGAPILARSEGSEAARVDDLRERTRAAILELHRSIGGTVAEEAGASTKRAGVP